MTQWRRGMLAVCINNEYLEATQSHAPFIELGCVYMVEQVLFSPLGNVGLALRGIVPRDRDGYLADRFRPAVVAAEPASEDIIALIKSARDARQEVG